MMLQKFHHNEYPSPCISIASTTLELLNWIKSVVGKELIKRKKNYSIRIVLKYNDALAFLEEIYHYLIINSKKKRAELILNKYKSVTSRNGRYSTELLKEKLDFYNEFISIK